MSVYIDKRLLWAIPTLLIVAIIVFFSIRLIPDDVIDLLLAKQYAGATPYDRPWLEHELGLDMPIYIQFGRWLGFLSTPDDGYNCILQGNLGKPLWTERLVTTELANGFPVSLELGFFALIKTEKLDDKDRKRITREAQAMGRLDDHPNIVTVYDISEHQGQPYIVQPVMSGDVEELI